MWPFKKSKQVQQEDYVDFPSNDADIEGIYRYLSWHMSKAGLSSNCFHFLEVLKTKASKENNYVNN